MRSSTFFKGVVLGALVAAVVMMAGTALAGTGIGAVFNLGKTNSVNYGSTLVGKTTGRMLNVEQLGTGTALNLKVQSGKPPMKVSSDVRVAKLNADSVDGVHSFRGMVTMTNAYTPVPVVNIPGFGEVEAMLVISSEDQRRYDEIFFTNNSGEVVHATNPAQDIAPGATVYICRGEWPGSQTLFTDTKVVTCEWRDLANSQDPLSVTMAFWGHIWY